jgi:hypothetical protein
MCEKNLQEVQLFKISTNDEIKVQFRNFYQQFWLQRDMTYPVNYSALWSIAKKFLIDFLSSYCVKRVFRHSCQYSYKKKKEIYWKSLIEEI